MVAIRFMTAEELERLGDGDVRRELIEGELSEMSPTGTHHVAVVSRLVRLLNLHVSTQAGVHIWVGEGGYLLQQHPDTVLAPDLAVLTDDQVQSISLASNAFTPIAPALVVEVKSPSDREAQIARTLAVYLAAGVREVWWIRPQDRQATIHRPDKAPQVIASDGWLTGGEIVPGFRVALSEVIGVSDD